MCVRVDSRPRLTTLLCALLLLSSGCSDPICPLGTEEVSGRCIAKPDAAASLDASSPANTAGAATSSGTGSMMSAATQQDGGLSSGVAGSASIGSGMGQNSMAPVTGETCAPDGAMRCSPRAENQSEACVGGRWTSSQTCDPGLVCTSAATGQTTCAAVAELCRGSGGEAVCDAQGTMLLCNPDGTVASRETCKNPHLCQAGIAARRCPQCLAAEEFRCTEKLLEVCDSDGESFVRKDECDTAGLCNALLGQCTTATCAPGGFACDGNTLAQCKADGTGFEPMTQVCTQGMCDAKGGDCNQCVPGQKTCDGAMVMTCNTDGQSYAPSSCPGADKCVGAGQCVECVVADDCRAVSTECTMAACLQNRCSATNNDGIRCTTAAGQAGMCSGGTCRCTPQCNKDCGDDGCGGTCPSRCARTQQCVNDECVDCTRDSDCSNLMSADRCTIGVCRSGSCVASDAPSSTSCTVPGTRATGNCSGGECVCEPDCLGVCGGDDGCGGTCPNTCSGSRPSCHPTTNRCVPYKLCPENVCDGDETSCSPDAGYCTRFCETPSYTCSPLNGAGRVCVDGIMCVFRPPCPDGLHQTTVTSIGMEGEETLSICVR